MIKKKKLGFPIYYGDTPLNEGRRLSDKVLVVIQTERFQNICSGLFSAVLILGSHGQVSNAIPPEVGEQIAEAAEAAVNAGQAADLVPKIDGRVAAAAANAPGLQPLIPQNPVPVANLPQAPGLPGDPGDPGGPPLPGHPLIYMPLGRPITPVCRTANTILFTGSFACICVNAYWGNPVAIAGCTVMVISWFGKVLGISLSFTK